jgi:MoxR-like ATPase
MLTVTTPGDFLIEFNNGLAVDAETGDKAHSLLSFLKERGLTVEEYLNENGRDASLFSPKVWKAFYELERLDDVTLVDEEHLYGMRLNLQAKDVSVLKMPARATPGYKFPEEGEAGKAAKRAVRHLICGRKLFIHGEAGTGKSSLVREWAYRTQREFLHVEMREDLDPASFLGQREVVIDPETKQNVTKFVPGKLLEALKGNVGSDGERRGVLILVDDIDRAPASYHEVFRHMLDDNARKIYVQELGHDIDIHPDTTFAVTANSRGRGDDGGGYASVMQMDASILDRLNAFVEMPSMDTTEECDILMKKFPQLLEMSPKTQHNPFYKVMKVAEDLRKMARTEHFPINFSHRRCEDWLRSIEDMTVLNGSYDVAFLAETASDWLDRFTAFEQDRLLKRAASIHVNLAL